MMPKKENSPAGLFGECDDDDNDCGVDAATSILPCDDTNKNAPLCNHPNTPTGTSGTSPLKLSKRKKGSNYRTSKFYVGRFAAPQSTSLPSVASTATTATTSGTPKGDAGLFGESSEGEDAVVPPSPLAIRAYNDRQQDDQSLVDSHVSAVDVTAVDELLVAQPVSHDQPIFHAAVESFHIVENPEHQMMQNGTYSKNNLIFTLLAMMFLIVGLVVGLVVGFGLQPGRTDSLELQPAPTVVTSQSAPTAAPSRLAPFAVPSQAVPTVLQAPYGNGSLGEWEFCNASSQCATGCCTSEFSTSDGKLKCTEVGGYRPDLCVPPAPEVVGYLDEWAFCNTSAQCANGCCSREFSTTDGELKCTRLPEFDPYICVSNDGAVKTSVPTFAPFVAPTT